MFGIFGCGKKIEKATQELKSEYETKIAKLENKIKELETELETRKKCSTNTLNKLNLVGDAINTLKKEIHKNESQPKESVQTIEKK